MKSLWAMVQGDPVFMRRVNGWLTVFWIVMIPISLFAGWLDSVVYVSALSLWALVSGHLAAWQAARVEVKQEQHEENDNGSSTTDLSAVRGRSVPDAGPEHLAMPDVQRRWDDRVPHRWNVEVVTGSTVAYFTFGSDHVLPDGRSARDEYVVVSCPQHIDPRLLFIAWLGSARFSSEYSKQEWVSQDMCHKHYGDRAPCAEITVKEYVRW